MFRLGALFIGDGVLLAIRAHVSERFVNVIRRVLPIFVFIALSVDEVDDTRPQEFLREVVAQLVLSHKGVAVAHALQDERHDDGHRHIALLMLCAVGAVVGLAIVIHIVAQVCHGVVWAVAAYRTRKMQFIGQAVLLDETVCSQRHGATLRIAYAHTLPVFLKAGEIVLFFIIFIQCQPIAHSIHHLTGRQLLIQVGVGTVLAHAVAFVIGQYDQAAGLPKGIISCVVNQHAYVGLP